MTKLFATLVVGDTVAYDCATYSAARVCFALFGKHEQERAIVTTSGCMSPALTLKILRERTNEDDIYLDHVDVDRDIHVREIV
jgi:hypothetical protein